MVCRASIRAARCSKASRCGASSSRSSRSEAIVERALAYCDWAVAKGLLAIRSHVDVCDPRLLAVDALLEVKRRVAPYLDLQLVAFPQDGVLRSPGALDNLKRALDKGVEVVGGIPHFERTMADGAESVRMLCELAGAARSARGHALRRNRRSDVAAHRDAERADRAPRPAGSGEWLASHVHAFDGQLLRFQADPADGRGAGERGGESAHQHHDPGSARYLSRSAAA